MRYVVGALWTMLFVIFDVSPVLGLTPAGYELSLGA